jgi:(p)ppGpp synthase/HD superfamily hydrolase
MEPIQNELPFPLLGRRFEEALVFAARLHARQVRKGTDIPYVSHLLGVTSLVLEDGGDEDEAIAALLHDAAEDQGGQETLDQIRQLFGERVARLVDGLTDTYDNPKPPWRQRKERYLAHLGSACLEVRRISLADKLHNARSILADMQQDSGMDWERFKGGKEGSLWYYRSLVEIFGEHQDGYLQKEFASVVEQIEKLAGQK